MTTKLIIIEEIIHLESQNRRCKVLIIKHSNGNLNKNILCNFFQNHMDIDWYERHACISHSLMKRKRKLNYEFPL